ncbi:MAG: hypothetical protein A4E32_00269 [Methanomassiliicoccales archaeon PtaU1.Bin124]|nr:MAG: hypothetical protein A4E32_00269 [Methanomassiliicoccales archaeon PtaU1.Bin124]
MNGTKTITSLIIALLAISLIMPAVAAETVDQQKGTTSVPAGGYKALVKIQALNDTSHAATYLGFYINQTTATSVTGFKVLLLDEDNYNKYTTGSAYTANKTWDSSNVFGKVIAFGFITLTEQKIFYLVVDNKANTGSLEIDYDVSVTNGDIIPIEEIIWAIWIVVIIVLAILVAVVLFLIMKHKKKNLPPAPPVPPQPPAP